jgi:hypothetical protein
MATLAMTAPALADDQPTPQASPTPAAAASAPPAMTANIPIRFFANVTLRQDWTTIQDKPDFLLEGNNVYGLLTRLRFGMEFKDRTSSVSGGIRVSAGEAPNPASPFVRLGNGFRPVSFGLDQFYVDVRPFGNKERVHAMFGKMPQPFWRGDKGVLRGEMILDDDISPVGATLHTVLVKAKEGQAVTLENVAGYFIVEWFQQARFSGLVGDTSLWADQLNLTYRWLTLTGEYYHWQNLNSGARAPSFEPGQSAILLPGQSAFLLRSGFQITNAELDVGSGVRIFRENEFDIFAASAQATIPVSLPLLGKSEVVLFGQYSHNSSVEDETDGYGVSLGVVGGDLKRKLKPFSLHGTWRKVEADAALATYADSDLGAGTDVKGFEITGDYRIHRNLALSASFFNFEGTPNRSTRIKRTFLAIVWDF